MINKRCIIGIVLGTMQVSSIFARSRPLEEISHPYCKLLHRSEHPDFCKISLPTIDQESFEEAYQKSDVLQLVYSLPWSSPYVKPINIGKGSHPSLDIATAKGTPVFAVGKGTVISQGEKRGYGNSITIQHYFNGRVIFTNYSHLDKIFVKVGDSIEEKQKIGEVGNSGFSIGKYGNHLDFQITTDMSPAHPYGFGEFYGEKYMDIVNQGLHQEKLELYTINPIKFFSEAKIDDESIWTTTTIQFKKAISKINGFLK